MRRSVHARVAAPERKAGAPAEFASRVERLDEVEARGKLIDKAFFYADFVVERVRETVR